MPSFDVVPTSGVTNDDTYYCTDLIIQIEKVRFRVPQEIFSQSEVFRDMFIIPSGDTTVDGSDNDHPLVLQGYHAEDFRQLLKVILPSTYSDPNLSPDQWTSVLKLSTTWEMKNVREAAINMLEGFGANDPILRLVVSKYCGVSHWFVPAVNALARREARIEYPDIERLKVIDGSMTGALDLAMKISWVRESFTGQRLSLPPSAPVELPFAAPMKVPDSPCCVESMYCLYHDVLTRCIGQGSKGGTPLHRAEHDFTEVICQICDSMIVTYLGPPVSIQQYNRVHRHAAAVEIEGRNK